MNKISFIQYLGMFVLIWLIIVAIVFLKLGLDNNDLGFYVACGLTLVSVIYVSLICYKKSGGEDEM